MMNKATPVNGSSTTRFRLLLIYVGLLPINANQRAQKEKGGPDLVGTALN